ncbi:MAG: hypothetical protein Q8807_03570, partial ['Waltheria sp.' little leaf phytoplasma]|nr:hypothetical protein ['Waltheria sp.' little leaf phytoplasma]
ANKLWNIGFFIKNNLSTIATDFDQSKLFLPEKFLSKNKLTPQARASKHKYVKVKATSVIADIIQEKFQLQGYLEFSIEKQTTL